MAALALALVLGVGLSRLSSRHTGELAPAAPVTLRIVRVVEDPAVAAAVFGAGPEALFGGGGTVALPEGGALTLENVSAGPGRTEAMAYLRLVPVAGETLEAALARGRTWAAARSVPLDPSTGPSTGPSMAEGGMVGFGPFVEFDEDTGVGAQVGWRSYLLAGDSILTERDVQRADAMPGFEPGTSPTVALALTPESSKRFAQATRESAGRRLAIVVDDVVTSAPLVMGEITGGQVQITMGSGDPEELLAEARRLAAALEGRRDR